LVIITEWDAFRSLDFERLRILLEQPVLVDLRNVYLASEVQDRGFTYFGIGRPRTIATRTRSHERATSVPALAAI
jgi:UDPglucose 6-dehydrogenase